MDDNRLDVFVCLKCHRVFNKINLCGCGCLSEQFILSNLGHDIPIFMSAVKRLRPDVKLYFSDEHECIIPVSSDPFCDFVIKDLFKTWLSEDQMCERQLSCLKSIEENIELP